MAQKNKAAIIAIMTILLTLATASFTTSFTSITKVSALSVAAATTSSLYLQESGGKVTSIGKVGDQYMVGTSIHNNREESMAFVILVEIRDSHGISRQLSWHSGAVAAGGNYTTGFSWIPDEPCPSEDDGPGCEVFELRSFVISSLVEPQVLSPVTTSEFVVVPPYYQNPKLFRVTIGSEQYNVVYSINSGEIRGIQSHAETGSLDISLRGVGSDGDLIVRLPAALVRHAFYLEAQQILSGKQEYYPSILVDSVEHTGAGVIELDRGQSIAFRIPVVSGSEEIQLAADRSAAARQA